MLTKKHKNKEVALTKEEKEKKAEETLEKSKRIQATKSVLILENLKKSRKDIDINAFKEKLEIAFKIALDVH
ncbi:MAG: hypothetical protein LBC61_03540 [Candidatus Peribacteria bacterium]|nr:hypothetical protein [Candidatus Peribacteria bacterium]